MPSPARKFIHHQPTKAPAEKFGLDAALIVWYGHNLRHIGGKPTMRAIPIIQLEVTHGGTTVKACFQSLNDFFRVKLVQAARNDSFR
jgi:hypothetical protein